VSKAQPEPAPPCAFVIFGATGDLTRRLLLPSLLHLHKAGLLPEQFAIVGVARIEQSADDFRRNLDDALNTFAKDEVTDEDRRWLLDRSTFVPGTFDDAETYERLKEHLEEVDRTRGTAGNRVFYLAVPAAVFATVAQGLGRAGLARQEPGGPWRRLIVEKPFGRDLASARELNRQLLEAFAEDQIYRIDHYLGKETVQNIMVLRFSNEIFERLWNRDHIDHVQITVAETVGVEHRGRFYDQTGALRDMVPNHLFQLLTLTAMEPPTCFAADAVRTEKAKVLDAVRRLTPEDVRREVVRGQYVAGTVRGEDIEAYRRSEEVRRDSVTETYVAMRLLIDNWRWTGVPFYLRTGKALKKRRSEVAIRFKRAPVAFFRNTAVDQPVSNDLLLHIQPEEGATLRFGAKVPGPQVHLGEVAMRFNYADYFETKPSTGYETLIYDCMLGDATLFQRADNIEAGWAVVQPILDAWARDEEPPHFYEAGSPGPREADALLERDGRHWQKIV
jgi:glucose-6-phosphate 1-dehydrogenase